MLDERIMGICRKGGRGSWRSKLTNAFPLRRTANVCAFNWLAHMNQCLLSWNQTVTQRTLSASKLDSTISHVILDNKINCNIIPSLTPASPLQVTWIKYYLHFSHDCYTPYLRAAHHFVFSVTLTRFTSSAVNPAHNRNTQVKEVPELIITQLC
jgi:hypothetical protein